MTGLGLPVLLAVRLHLLWAAGRVCRNPAPAVLAAAVAVLTAGLVVLAAWSPPPACHLRAAAGGGRPHWACGPAARTAHAP